MRPAAPTPPRRARGVLAAALGLAALGLAAPGAPAQSSGDGRGDVVVPLPNGAGVFYYRSGAPGGVRIRSRNGQAASGPRAAAAFRSDEDDGLERLLRALEQERGAGVVVPATRADLLRLELALQRVERRLGFVEAELARQRGVTVVPSPAAPGAPVIVVPGAPQAPAPVLLPQPPAPPAPALAVLPPLEPPAEPRAPLAPVEPLPPQTRVEEVERAILDTGLFRTTRVNFRFGRADLLPTADETIEAVGEVLVRYPALRVEVAGHTDNVGSAAFNVGLSERRAETVRAALLVRFPDIGPGRLRAAGYGLTEPIATNETETGRALNRRVEFRLLNPEAAEEVRRTVREEPAPAPVPEDERLRRIIREELERLRRDG